MQTNSKILIIGHDDVIERSLVKHYQSLRYTQISTASQLGLDTTIQPSVYDYFQKKRPDYVFLGSVASGGIEANTKFPADMTYKNMASQSNILYAAWKFGVKKLLYIAGSCVYPKKCTQPMREEYLFSGELEETSQSYAVAKLAGIELCRAYKRQHGLNAIAVVPATIYGPGSDTDLVTAHVLGALIGKFQSAVNKGQPQVDVWGTGEARREFLYAEDFADACDRLMENYDNEQIINAGVGKDVSIKELAQMIAQTAGFKGKIVFDAQRNEGTKQKLLDSTRINRLGWKPKTDLKDGIKMTVDWYKQSLEQRVA